MGFILSAAQAGQTTGAEQADDRNECRQSGIGQRDVGAGGVAVSGQGDGSRKNRDG